MSPVYYESGCDSHEKFNDEKRRARERKRERERERKREKAKSVLNIKW